jgi:very-short-patch-repair endonuclease
MGVMNTKRARNLRKNLTDAEQRLFWNNEVLGHADAVTQAILDCVEARL